LNRSMRKKVLIEEEGWFHDIFLFARRELAISLLFFKKMTIFNRFQWLTLEPFVATSLTTAIPKLAVSVMCTVVISRVVGQSH
jgi:hypothetical protein